MKELLSIRPVPIQGQCAGTVSKPLKNRAFVLKKTYAVFKKSVLLEYAASLEVAVSYNFSGGTEIGANNVMVYKPIF